MARGTTLGKLIDDLRAETRKSLNPAHNVQVRETQVKLLQRVQERLWDEFAWPHLRIERQVPAQAGQRFYETPADMAVDRIEAIELFSDGGWQALQAGIGGEHYASWNSDLDQRSWPPRRWKIAESEDIEIWPVADINANPTTRDGYLRFIGIRNLRPLVDDNDTAELDDQIIVLYAAAEMLAAEGSKDAKLKLDQANAIYARKRSGLTPRRTYRMFGVGGPHPPRRMIAHYRPGS